MQEHGAKVLAQNLKYLPKLKYINLCNILRYILYYS